MHREDERTDYRHREVERPNSPADDDSHENRGPTKWPDFEKRMKDVFGDRVLTAVADLIADRDAEEY